MPALRRRPVPWLDKPCHVLPSTPATPVLVGRSQSRFWAAVPAGHRRAPAALPSTGGLATCRRAVAVVVPSSPLALPALPCRALLRRACPRPPSQCWPAHATRCDACRVCSPRGTVLGRVFACQACGASACGAVMSGAGPLLVPPRLPSVPCRALGGPARQSHARTSDACGATPCQAQHWAVLRCLPCAAPTCPVSTNQPKSGLAMPAAACPPNRRHGVPGAARPATASDAAPSYAIRLRALPAMICDARRFTDRLSIVFRCLRCPA
jgi:hypothetical protein